MRRHRRPRQEGNSFWSALFQRGHVGFFWGGDGHAHTHIYIHTCGKRTTLSTHGRGRKRTGNSLLRMRMYLYSYVPFMTCFNGRKEGKQLSSEKRTPRCTGRTVTTRKKEREREVVKAFLVVMVYNPESMPGASADNKTEQNVPPSRCGDVRRCRRCRQREQCTPAPQRTISFATLPSQLHEHASRASGSTDTQRFPINQRYISSDHCLQHICLK